MTDPSGCPHPETNLITIEAESTFVCWCPHCGSICDNNGDHGAPAGTWRTPALVLPGWTCPNCRAFNGCAKELLLNCRACGQSKGTVT